MNSANNEARQQKSEIVGGTTYLYSSDWIKRLENEVHWSLYWKQLDLIVRSTRPGESLLEIGVGTGVSARRLHEIGLDVVTMDIDADKQPDIVANIVDYDFPHKYDNVSAFEVFEHIPFDQFLMVLGRLLSRAKRNVFFSVPRRETILFEARIARPRRLQRRIVMKKRKRQISEVHHFWELDPTKKAMNDFVAAIHETGFQIEESFEFESRHFFRLRPSNSE